MYTYVWIWYVGGNEFGFGYEFIDALTKGYLACNRGPITTSKVKYPIGKVFDRKEKKAQQSVHEILDNAGISDVVFDENAFSEYESEDLEDDNNSDNEVIQDEQFMDANDVTLGFEWLNFVLTFFLWFFFLWFMFCCFTLFY